MPYTFMPCTLEINSIGWFKQDPQKHYISTTTMKRGELPWEVSTHKTTWLCNHVVSQDRGINYNHISSTTILMTTSIGRVVNHNNSLGFMSSNDNINTSYLHCTWPMAIKYSQALTRCEELLLLKSHYPLNTWRPRKITW